MTSLLEALQGIVQPSRIVLMPGELTEDGRGNRCEPLRVRHKGACWALRLKSGDHLPVLAELEKERSLRKLPDYLIFSEPPSEDAALQVLVCELKSGAVGAEKALVQVRLGKLLAGYLVRLAAHSIEQAEVKEPWCCGLIASPEFPTSMIAKGRTRPGRMEPPWFRDSLYNMKIYQLRGGEELWLENIFG
jgi:hypothetical protein